MGSLKALLESSNEELRPEIVSFLVKMYAEEGHGQSLSYFVGSLAHGGSRAKLTGGLHVDLDKVSAVYDQKKRRLIVNTDVKKSLRDRVIDVLHEIQHYNQHMLWESSNEFRDRFVAGKKLPPDIESDPIMLYEISWNSICKFWERRYQYWKSPHEKDARKFADETVDEAMKFIEQHFSDDE